MLEPGGLAGWEMSLYFDGPVPYLGYLIPYNHINVGILPGFSVGAELVSFGGIKALYR